MRVTEIDELAKLISYHAAQGETTEIPRLLVSSAAGPNEPETSNTGTVFALIAKGTKRLSIGDRTYEYGPGQFLVASVDLPITGHYVGASADDPALGVGLILEPAKIADLLLETEGDGPPVRPVSTPPALGVGTASIELVDAMVRMLRLLEEPRDQAVIAPIVEREVLWRLMTGPLGETVRQIGLSDSSLTHVSEAIRWISANYAESFRVEDLARSCGMSTSAFHRSFQAATSLSPIRFQKQIRLQKARLMLISGTEDAGSIGFKVGYESASQFSREYRRQFGAPPGQDRSAHRRPSRL